MILDNETNMLYFSSLIKENEKYSQFWKRLHPVLSENKISFDFIENTKDIWCRDYMPLQIKGNDYVQFVYFPDYLINPKHISKLTIPSETRITDRINKSQSKLIVDGGNIVKSKTTAILTDKVLKENSNLEPTTVISLLKKELGVERVFLIPIQPFDFTGHADGMVRFVDEETIIVNDFYWESLSWRKKLRSALVKTGLNIIEYPVEKSDIKNDEGDYTAMGVYINFAQIGNIILFPQFGLKTDLAALRKTNELYPQCNVIPLLSNEIAEYGGVLNCITWNIMV